jgi:aerobic-type carbon monoxide dehydrogenase small subunit (CoxS/CutS family)
MATADISGLFGGALTPEEQQRQLTEARAAQFAQLAPSQQLAFMGYKAGAGLGQGLAQAAGVDIQDPSIKRATMLRQMAQGIDVTTIDGLKQYAQKLQQAGFTAEAHQIAGQIQAMLESQSKQFQQTAAGQASVASAGKAGAETQEIIDKRAAKNSRVKMLVDAGFSEAEAQAISSNDTAFAKLVENKRIATPADYAVQAQALGFGSKPYLSDYTPEQIKAMEQGVFKHKAGIAAAGATAIRIPLGELMDRAYLEKDRQKAAEAWSQAGEAYTAGAGTLSLLDNFEKTAKTGFTGAGSDTKLALSKALGAVGVNLGPKASDTEISNALSSQLVQQIAKVFPGSQSNKELGELLKSKPNISQELPTILRLIDKMRTEIQSKQMTYEQGSALPDKERANWNPKIAEVKNFKMLNRYKELVGKYNNATISDTERAEAKKIKEELKL